MRTAFSFALLAAATLAPAAAFAQAPATTRIETRPFYGATVTLEEGVRVFRPLPPHERVIINPNGATPLSLGYEQKTSVSHNHYYGGAGSSASASADGGSGGWVGPVYGRDRHHGRHHGRARGINHFGGHRGGHR